MTLNIVVTGGRNYRDKDYLFAQLDTYTRGFSAVRVAHGGASGADSLADQWACARSHEIVVYHAEWERHGRSAGPKRNRKMLEAEQPDLVIAFPGGRGTDDCVARAHALGIRVIDLRSPTT